MCTGIFGYPDKTKKTKDHFSFRIKKKKDKDKKDSFAFRRKKKKADKLEKDHFGIKTLKRKNKKADEAFSFSLQKKKKGKEEHTFTTKERTWFWQKKKKEGDAFAVKERMWFWQKKKSNDAFSQNIPKRNKSYGEKAKKGKKPKKKWWKLNIKWRFWKTKAERNQMRQEENSWKHSTRQDEKDKRRKRRNCEMDLFPKEMRK